MEKKLFYILAAIIAMRAKYWNNKAKANHDEVAMGAGIAYDNAFDLLAYAIHGNWDCLRQFAWSDEAEELINKIGIDIDLWDLEDLIKKGLDKPTEV